MALRTIVEDFQRMGLSKKDTQTSLTNMLGETSEEVPDAGEGDDDDEDILGIVEAYKKRKKLKGKAKKAARAYRRSAKGKAAAKKAAKKQKRKRKTSAYKKHQAKIRKMGKAKKGYIRVVSSREYDDEGESLRESLVRNLHVLAEAMEHDSEGRFKEYVEAFNNIADLGELLTLQYHEMDEEELAGEAAELAVLAESILEQMEEFNGVVTIEQDEALEEALANAMALVEDELEQYSEIVEEDEDLDDDEELDEDDELDEDEDDEDFDDLIEAAKKAAKKAKKKGKGGGKKKKGKMSAFVKQLAKRKDIRDPEAVAGYIDHYGSHNRSED